MKNNNTAAFWLTNISNMNVSLTDLNLTVKAYSCVNLLDAKHYYYTPEQLQKSAESGSIFKKRNKLVVRKISPEILQPINFQFGANSISVVHDAFIPSRERSVLTIKEENYEELNISDEQFADENAEIVELDTKPIKKV